MATSAFDAAAQRIAEGLGDATKIVLTFWTELPLGELSVSSGPVSELRGMTGWLTAFVAVLSVTWAAGKMALTRSGRPAEEAAQSLVRLVLVAGAGVPAVAAVGHFTDAYAAWILDRSADGDLGARMALLGALTSRVPGIGPGLILIVGFVGILASLAQMGLMIVRVGVVTIFAGILPLAAAGSGTETGRASWQRVLSWLLAFLMYKPAAATVYAAAFLLVGKGESATAVLSGLFLMILSILALPALMRLVTPVVGAASSGAGAAAAAAGVTAAASGARILADRGSSPSSGPAQGPHQPGLVGGAGSGAGPGGAAAGPGPASGSGGSGGGRGGAASAAAGGASGSPPAGGGSAGAAAGGSASAAGAGVAAKAAPPLAAAQVVASGAQAASSGARAAAEGAASGADQPAQNGTSAQNGSNGRGER